MPSWDARRYRSSMSFNRPLHPLRCNPPTPIQNETGDDLPEPDRYFVPYCWRPSSISHGVLGHDCSDSPNACGLQPEEPEAAVNHPRHKNRVLTKSPPKVRNSSTISHTHEKGRSDLIQQQKPSENEFDSKEQRRTKKQYIRHEVQTIEDQDPEDLKCLCTPDIPVFQNTSKQLALDAPQVIKLRPTGRKVQFAEELEVVHCKSELSSIDISIDTLLRHPLLAKGEELPLLPPSALRTPTPYGCFQVLDPRRYHQDATNNEGSGTKIDFCPSRVIHKVKRSLQKTTKAIKNGSRCLYKTPSPDTYEFPIFLPDLLGEDDNSMMAYLNNMSNIIWDVEHQRYVDNINANYRGVPVASSGEEMPKDKTQRRKLSRFTPRKIKSRDNYFDF